MAIKNILLAAALTASFAANAEMSLDSLSSTVKQMADNSSQSSKVYGVWEQVKQGYPDALKKLENIAQSGDAEAQNYMGWLYDNGMYGVPKNPQNAVQFFNASAAKGNDLGIYNLGVMAMAGRGTPQNEKAAFKLFSKSAETKAVPRACVQAAILGIKLKQSPPMITENISCATDASNVTGFYLAGRIEYEAGRYKNALGLLEKAAGGNDPNSPWLISNIYSGVPDLSPNTSMAAAWWLIGASRNPNKTGVNAGGVSQFNLTDSEINEARGFAQRWMTEHPQIKPINYSKTIINRKD